eukprot:TRINITY_DN6583_c0_g1_i2.p1 TRINITY_DN6583_c0_g1~~TRINITY_DN6583_c0_g1_i2.p1  ORF type:complete len:721 (+),score=146.32 TRINITY_DN6583_c0_g1_i2:70-2232(+)
MYRSYAQPAELGALWMAEYKQASEEQHQLKLIKLTSFLKLWATHFMKDDFSTNKLFMNTIIRFIVQNLPKSEANKLKLMFIGNFKQVSASQLSPGFVIQKTKGGNVVRTRSFSAIYHKNVQAVNKQATTESGSEKSATDDSHLSLKKDARKSKLGKTSTLSIQTDRMGSRAPHSPRSGKKERKSAFLSRKFNFKHKTYIHIEDISAGMLAMHMTTIESEVFTLINTSELSHLQWQKETKDEDGNIIDSAPNVNFLTERFNLVSFWIATEVVTAPTPKSRLNVLKKFIRTAKKLRQMNSFNCLMEVVAGLNNSSVSRLKRMWAGVEGRLLADWQELDELMTPAGNFRNYREALEQVLTNLNKTTGKAEPVIPYMATILKDISVAYDGNKEFLPPEGSEESDETEENNRENGKTRINYELLSMIGKQISIVLKCQSVPFANKKPTDDRVMEFLRTIRPVDQNLLQQFSENAQPSGRRSSARTASFSDAEEKLISGSKKSKAPSKLKKETSDPKGNKLNKKKKKKKAVSGKLKRKESSPMDKVNHKQSKKKSKDPSKTPRKKNKTKQKGKKEDKKGEDVSEHPIEATTENPTETTTETPEGAGEPSQVDDTAELSDSPSTPAGQTLEEDETDGEETSTEQASYGAIPDVENTEHNSEASANEGASGEAPVVEIQTEEEMQRQKLIRERLAKEYGNEPNKTESSSSDSEDGGVVWDEEASSGTD